MLGENIKTYRQVKQFTQEEVAANIVITVLGMVFFSVSTSTGNVQTYEETEITELEE
jgi:transcriptional regulator with XRE-family HTH domain